MRMTPLTRIWMVLLRGYLVVASRLALVRIIELATAEHSLKQDAVSDHGR